MDKMASKVLKGHRAKRVYQASRVTQACQESEGCLENRALLALLVYPVTQAFPDQGVTRAVQE